MKRALFPFFMLSNPNEITNRRFISGARIMYEAKIVLPYKLQRKMRFNDGFSEFAHIIPNEKILP